MRSLMIMMVAAVLALRTGAATTWYVSKSGSDSNNGKSESAAFLTIQKAVDTSAAGDRILVMPGTYAPITTENKLLCIEAVEGYSKTFIDAGGSGECVNAAVGGDVIYVGGGCTNTLLIGFTIRNGGRGCAGGTIERCHITSCQGAEQGAGAQASTLNNCLLTGNGAYSMGGAAAYCVLRNCTVYGNMTNLGAGGLYVCAATNSIVYGNSAQIYPDALDSTLVSCYTSDPKFVNATGGDFHLLSVSGCINAGNNVGVVGTLDLDGKVRIAGEKVDIGCYEYGSSAPVEEEEPEVVDPDPGAVGVRNVRCTPRYPWNGLVDIEFTLDGDGGYAEPQAGDEMIPGHRLQFVRSAGDVQLNTGIVPGSRNTIEVKVAWEGTGSSPKGCLFCARGATTTTSTFTGFILNGKWRFDYKTTLGSENDVPVMARGTPVVIRDVAGTASVDGSAVQSHAAASFTVGGPLTLFSSYVGTPGTTVDNYFAGKIYYLKIYGNDGTTLLHHFIPWEKNGEAGMYDLVGARFVTPNVGVLSGGTHYRTGFTARDVTGGTNVVMSSVCREDGVTAASPEWLLPGTYRRVWDARGDVGDDFVSEMNIAVSADIQTYSVVFNANGGTGTMSNESFTYGTSKALTANAFTRTGYTFAGWATSAGGGVKYTNKQSVNNLTATAGGTVTLYAKWTGVSYSVKFNANGGTGTMSNESFTYGTSKALTANAFKRTGYTFSGWATSAGGGVKYTNKQTVNNLTSTAGGTVNLYAVWKK